jgi:hypothetical protein
MSESTERPNLFFRLTTFVGAVFVVTILALVATVFSDPRAPSVQFLSAHGTTLVVWEVAAILVLGLLAMMLDRWRSLRELKRDQRPGPASPAPAAEPRHQGEKP